MTGLQPLLDQATVALAAPAQVWSASSGALEPGGIHGFYVGDRRILSELAIRVDGVEPEIIATATPGADRAEFTSLLRTVDDSSADPRVRLRHRRTVLPTGLRDAFTVESTLTTAVTLNLSLRLRVDFAQMDSVKAGLAGALAAVKPEIIATAEEPADVEVEEVLPPLSFDEVFASDFTADRPADPVTSSGTPHDENVDEDTVDEETVDEETVDEDAADGDAVDEDAADEDAADEETGDAGVNRPALDVSDVLWSDGAVEATLNAPGARFGVTDDDELEIVWTLELQPKSRAEVAFNLDAAVGDAVVGPPVSPSPWSEVTLAAEDVRLRRWVERALDDLAALRMSVATVDDAVFLAAGAPWFFTLFGRDSIWAARMMLPLGTGLAADTLRVLATMQGEKNDPMTAEQPGKIMHELRASALEIPAEGVVLPPLYFGTVDATALWICLLHDAWRWGLAEEEIVPLLPHLEAALAWLRDYGDSDGDGFLEYIDESGRGLANQGWKDSGDSVQWNDGRLAKGPIALCEVQGYAYEAAMGGAALLDHFDRPGGAEWRTWAGELKRLFSEQFWVDGPDGAYPAIALDASKRPVDSLTSNIGHLLGTGILGREQANLVATHLASPKLSSGYGLRTMSTDAEGYWPLSYHGGSVWAHDTAIAVLGLQREGFTEEAAVLSEGLLAAAEGFSYRMPELHSGDSASETATPIPYPAACRPQAWSAAAAIAVLTAALGLQPIDRETLSADASGSRIARGVRLTGARVGEAGFTVTVTGEGHAGRSSSTATSTRTIPRL